MNTPDLFPRIFNRRKLAAPGVSRTMEGRWWQSLTYRVAGSTGMALSEATSPGDQEI